MTNQSRLTSAGTVFTPPAPPLYAFTPHAAGASTSGGGAAVSAATAARVTDPAARAAYWDAFYRRNGGRFFKDRHWLGREFGEALAGAASVLEVGCGVGNGALMMLRASAGDDGPASSSRTVWACDFAPTGVGLMVDRAVELGLRGRLRAFVADATVPGSLCGGDGRNAAAAAAASPFDAPPPAGSIDAATLLFALSAMPPGPTQAAAVANVAAALRPGGVALVRDYCSGDLAQARLAARAGGRRLEVEGGGDGPADGGLFMRGDGTLAYYFAGAPGLASLFEGAGFTTLSARVVEATKVNRASGASMPRRWVQGVFRWGGGGAASVPQPAPRARARRAAYRPEWEGEASSSSSYDDDGDAGATAAPSAPSPSSSSSSDGATRAAARLLGGDATADGGTGLPPLEPATLALPPPLGPLPILAAPGELRNTTGHTGLLVWGSAPALASALLVAAAASGGSLPFLRAGPVLEVGCGASPALALAALSAGAPRYVASDGSRPALALFARNFGIHAWRVVAERARAVELAWGGDGGGVAALVGAHAAAQGGFSTLLGADVLYSPPAVPRLMATVAAALAPGPSSLALFCLQVRSVSLEAVTEAAGDAGLVPAPLPPGLAAAAGAGGVGRPGDLLQLLAFSKRRAVVGA